MQFSVYLEKSDRSVIIIDRFTSHINAVAFQKHTNNLLVEENKIKTRKKMGKKTPAKQSTCDCLFVQGTHRISQKLR